MKVTSFKFFVVAAVIFVSFCDGARILVKRADNEADPNLDANGRCKTERTWMNDCNRCWCDAGYVPACTYRGCFHLPNIAKVEIAPKDEEQNGGKIRVKRSDIEVDSNLDSNGRCKVERSWNEDCNTCWCGVGSVPACTLKGCIHLPERQHPVVHEGFKGEDKENGATIRVKRSDIEVDSNLDSDGRCKAARSWKNDCNTCFCGVGGVPACTLIGCVHLERLHPVVLDPEEAKENGGTIRVKRSDSEDDSNLDSDGRCKAERSWKNDCNTCFCGVGSVPACTEIGCIH